MTDNQPDTPRITSYITSDISEGKLGRFDKELIDKYFNDRGKQAIYDWALSIALEVVEDSTGSKHLSSLWVDYEDLKARLVNAFTTVSADS